MEKPSQHWMKNVTKYELDKISKLQFWTGLVSNFHLAPRHNDHPMGIQISCPQSFQCKQSKEMGTGSEDANRMPIEFSLQLAFCWQMVIRSWKSAAKCVIRPPLNLFAAKTLMRFATTKDHPSVWLPFGHANEHVRILRLQATDSKFFKAALELLILTNEREMPLQQKVKRLRCIGCIEISWNVFSKLSLLL